MDTWEAVDEERSVLANDLGRLEAAQWDVQSLCNQWKVRHVVGHLIAGAELKARPFLVGMLKSGMSFNRFMARQGLVLGMASPDELLSQFSKTIGAHRAAPGANSEVMLIDIVCHGVDIRRPTGMIREVPQDALLRVADLVKRVGFPFHAKDRIAGLRLAATDFAWSTGDGPLVEGPLESVILAMAGRVAVLDDLSGEGTEILRNRK